MGDSKDKENPDNVDFSFSGVGKEIELSAGELSKQDLVYRVTPLSHSQMHVNLTTEQLRKNLRKGVSKMKKRFESNPFSCFSSVIGQEHITTKMILRLDDVNPFLKEGKAFIGYGDTEVFDGLMSLSGVGAEMAMWQLIYDIFNLRMPSPALLRATEKGVAPDIAALVLREACSDDPGMDPDKFFLDTAYRHDNEKIKEIVRNARYITVADYLEKEPEGDFLTAEEIEKSGGDISKNISVFKINNEGRLEKKVYSAKKLLQATGMTDMWERSAKNRLKKAFSRISPTFLTSDGRDNYFAANLLIESILGENKDKYVLIALPSYRPEKKLSEQKHSRYARDLYDYLTSKGREAEVLRITTGRKIGSYGAR